MEQQNLLIAIVLSIAILIAFQFIVERMAPPTTRHAPGSHAPATPAPIAGRVTTPAVPLAGRAVLSRRAAIAAAPHLAIDTPRLHGSIALEGALFDDLTLATYHVGVDPKSPEVVLLRPVGAKDPYFIEVGWQASTPDIKLPGPHTLWKAVTEGPLTPSHPVTLTWDNGAGLVFTRTIWVDRNYMFTVEESVRNTGTAPMTLFPYVGDSRSGTPPASGYYILHVGLAGYLAGHVLGSWSWTHPFTDHDTYANLTPGEPRTYSSIGGWLGFTDKYWLTALVPPQNDAITARFVHTEANGVNRYEADFVGPATTVAAGATARSATRFFAGAKELDLLRAYTAAGVPKFDLAIDFGLFSLITEPIFLTLQLFGRVLGNFGLGILLLTLVVKLLFFPLANRSYNAMSKMKLLQPEIQKLRERFPDDKARQQQEIMGLYKRSGANPVAGCLPMVIQIPVFFSLYKVLYVTIEMRHAPFFGWIRDLSAPDPTSFVNLFGLLPFAPTHVPVLGDFLSIGAWPLIMGVTMFLQQKLNPQPVEPVQARMMMALPVVFTFMLARFPAGLVIYWAWNNTLSIAQQWVIMRRRGAA
jgi:YidC/Oxa1 family membrane protein insertase